MKSVRNRISKLPYLAASQGEIIREANASFQECRPSQFRPSLTRHESQGVVLVHHEKEKKNNSNGKLVIECRALSILRDFQRHVEVSPHGKSHGTKSAHPIAINRRTFNETERSIRPFFFLLSFLSRSKGVSEKTCEWELSSRTPSPFPRKLTVIKSIF